MNNRKLQNKRNKGAAMGFVLVFITLFVLLGTSMMMMAQANMRQVAGVIATDRHFFAAESMAHEVAQAFATQFSEHAFYNAEYPMPTLSYAPTITYFNFTEELYNLVRIIHYVEHGLVSELADFLSTLATVTMPRGTFFYFAPYRLPAIENGSALGTWPDAAISPRRYGFASYPTNPYYDTDIFMAGGSPCFIYVADYLGLERIIPLANWEVVAGNARTHLQDITLTMGRNGQWQQIATGMPDDMAFLFIATPISFQISTRSAGREVSISKSFDLHEPIDSQEGPFGIGVIINPPATPRWPILPCINAVGGYYCPFCIMPPRLTNLQETTGR